jgi:hypothetical protein
MGRFPDAAPQMLEEIRNKGRGDLYFFAREICGYTLLEEEPHAALCRWLARPSKTGRRMVFGPRVSYKSTITTTAYPLWKIVQDRSERILVESDLVKNARKFTGLIKRHLERNPRLLQLYGDFQAPTGWTEDGFTVSDRDADYREPTVMPGGTDQVAVGFHYRRIIGDDMVNHANTNTKEQMEKVLEHVELWGPLLELEEIDPGVEILLVGTFWDDADPHRSLLRKSGLSDQEIMSRLEDGEAQIGEWEVFFRSAYQDSTGRQIIGATGPVKLFSKFTDKYLDQQRETLGPYQFSANFLMDPVPAGETTFQAAWYRRWAPPIDNIDDMIVAMFVDPASGRTGRSSSSSAIVVIAATLGKKIYVLYTWKAKVPPDQLVDEVFTTFLIYQPHLVGFDSAVFQKILKLVIDDESARRGVWLPIKEVPPVTTTVWEARVRGMLQPLYAGGHVFHAHGMTDLELELKRFPKGRDDDLIDALVGAVSLLSPVQGPSTRQRGEPAPPENTTTGY